MKKYKITFITYNDVEGHSTRDSYDGALKIAESMMKMYQVVDVKIEVKDV